MVFSFFEKGGKIELHYILFLCIIDKMPIPKLFLYKARDAPIVAILRRDSYKHNWELIKWDVENDIFTRGQWLTKAVMNGSYCAISPDGKYFAYHYSSLRKDAHWKSYGVVSELPYFSACLMTHYHAGMWDGIGFDNQGSVMHTQAIKGFIKKRVCDLQITTEYKKESLYNGFVEGGSFVDGRGRTITTEKGILYANGSVLYDSSDHAFQSLVCPLTPCVEETVVPASEPFDNEFAFQNSETFMFTRKEEGRRVTYMDNLVDLNKNTKEVLLNYSKSLGLKVNGKLKKESIIKAIMESPNVHPLLKQYNDPTFMDGSALHAYDGNVVDARKATVERIKRDMMVKVS